MDKTKQILIIHTSKRGFALMITLSVLSVVIALTLVLLSYFKEVKNDAEGTRALIQANVYYADIVEQFSKFKDKKSLFSQLYLHPIPLSTDNGRFSLNLSCKALSSGININWFAMERDTKKSHLYVIIKELFEFLEESYKLEDMDRLLELIEIEIGHGRKFVKDEQRRLIQKNAIISYKQFSEIIKRYEMELDDQKVGKIPWQDYLSFSKKSEKIDIEYSSIALISFIFDINRQTVSEWKYARERVPLATFVNNSGGDYAGKKNLIAGSTFLGESQCTLSYGNGYKFTFDYIEGDAKYFEFHTKY